MASILIKDKTKEQREQIVRESLGDDYDVGCGYESRRNKIKLCHAVKSGIFCVKDSHNILPVSPSHI